MPGRCSMKDIGTGDDDAGQMQYERYQDPVQGERIIIVNRLQS